MTKFFKQEVYTFDERKYFYRLQTKGNLNLNDIAELVAFPGSGINKGTVMHVMECFINEMAHSIGKGYNINIEGLGSFKARLDMSENKRVRIGNIHFKAEKSIIEKSNIHCKLTMGGTKRIKHSPFTKEERLQLALSFLEKEENLFMTTEDYMKLTKLSKAKALKELFELRNSEESGITCIGRGNRKVYVLSEFYKTSG